jgi:hypothetical protein
MISICTIFSLDDKSFRLYHAKPKIKVKYHKHKIFIPFTIIPDPANIEGFEFLSLPSALYEQEPVKVGYWSVNKKTVPPCKTGTSIQDAPTGPILTANSSGTFGVNERLARDIERSFSVASTAFVFKTKL